MKSFLDLIFLLMCLCSNFPSRAIASSDSDVIHYSEISLSKSGVQFSSPEIKSDSIHHHLYLFFKNSSDESVDFDPKDLTIKNSNGEGIGFILRRLKKGQYYVTLEQRLKAPPLKMSFYFRGVVLKDQLTLFNSIPSAARSGLKKMKAEGNKVTLILTLLDEEGKFVDLSNPPEVITGSDFRMESMQRVGTGLWEITISIPQETLTHYLSIRAGGVYMPNLLRYQHVEK